MIPRSASAVFAMSILASIPSLAQIVVTASLTTTAGASKMTSPTLKLARSWSGTDFLTNFGTNPPSSADAI